MNLLSKEEVKYFQTHQNEITSELLEALRCQGKQGKQQALEILDLTRNNDNYYLDAYGNIITYMGNRKLKPAFTKLALQDIHLMEIERCMKDILYFLDNYIRLITPKDGVNFVDSREYQRDFLKLLSDDSIENVISMQPRQASKTTTTGVKLAHWFCFGFDLTMGIVAYSAKSSMEFLDKTKKMLIELPIWLQPGIVTWNKGSIECENNVRILTDVPKSDSFRGFSCHIIVVDECIGGDSTITIQNKYLGITVSIKIEELFMVIQSKEFFLEKFKKLEGCDTERLEHYLDFCLLKARDKTKYETDEHHILPKGASCFPEFENEGWNKIFLSFKDHYIAHSLLALAFPKNRSIVYAWNAMTNMAPKFKNDYVKNNPLTPEDYQELKRIAAKNISEFNKGIVTAFDGTKYVKVTKEEFNKNREQYTTHNEGKYCVTFKETGEKIWIDKREYNPDLHLSHTLGKAKFLNVKTLQKEWISSKDRTSDHIFTRDKIVIKRGDDTLTIQAKDIVPGDIFLYRDSNSKLTEEQRQERERIEQEKKLKHQEEILKKREERRKQRLEKQEEEKRQREEIRREIIESQGRVYKFRAPTVTRRGFVTAFDEELQKVVSINSEEFKENPKRYSGVTKNLIPVIDRLTGEIQRIPREDFDKAKYKKAPCGGYTYTIFYKGQQVFGGVISEIKEYFKEIGIQVSTSNIKTAAFREEHHRFYKFLHLDDWEVYAKK